MAFMDFLPQFSDNTDQSEITDPTLQAINLKRKLALADSLRNAPMPQGQMIGNRYVAPSWTQYLAGAVDKGMADVQEKKAMKEYADFQKSQQAKMADVLKSLTPHTEEVQLDVNQAGGMPGVMQTQQVQPDINAAIQGMSQLNPEFGTKLAEARITKALTPKEPIKLGAGDILLDPSTMQPLYTAPKSAGGHAPQIQQLLEYQKTLDPKSADYKIISDAIKKESTFASNIENATFSPEVLNTMADQALAGDKSVFTGLGRGQQGAKNIVALRTAINNKMLESGLSGKDIAAKNAEFMGLMAGERAVGTRGANIELAGSGFENIVPIAQQASLKVSRSGFLPFGKAEIMFNEQTNNPALSEFAAANNGLINTYARAISPTGVPTVEDKKHARKILSEAKDQEAYNAAVTTLQKEIQAEKRAPAEVRSSLRNQISPSGSGAGKVIHWNDLPR
jgi:hypothetical protein